MDGPISKPCIQAGNDVIQNDPWAMFNIFVNISRSLNFKNIEKSKKTKDNYKVKHVVFGDKKPCQGNS